MLFFGDNLGRSMQDQDKDEWFAFLNQMRKLAQTHRYTFSPQNLSRLKHSLAGQAAVKEGLFEGYYGSRRESFIGEPTEARILIKHNKIIGEDDKRYRYIESIFIETADGERFKLQSNRLIHGRAMLEHVRQGGRPYDVRGNHINEMVQELSVLSRFNRAKQHHVYEGITQELVESAAHYYRSLQENLKRLSSSRGYHTYFELWAPDQIDQQESLVEDLKNMFVQQTLDTRIEAALPTLAKIQQQGTKMKEAEIFENYMNRLSEGTWALPDTPEAYEKLQQLMTGELIVGADAMNATEQLYDLVGDDELFDILNDLADNDPRANIWDDSDVQRRLAELGVQTPQSTQAAPAAVPQDTAPPAVPPVAEGFGDKNTSEYRNNFINWIVLNQLDYYEDELLDYFDKFVDGGGSEYKAGEQAVNTWKARMKRDGESVSKPPMAEGEEADKPKYSMSNPGKFTNQEYKDSMNQRYGKPDLDTSRMNKSHQDFYNKNPSFKQSGKQIVTPGDGRLASKVVPAVTDTKVDRIPMNTFGAKQGSDIPKSIQKGGGSATSRMTGGGGMGGGAGLGGGGKDPMNRSINPLKLENAELARMLEHAGVPLQEGVLNDDTRNTWDHLLDRFRHEVENFKQTGDLDDDLYDAVFDYYNQHGAMPYRVQKAKDGTANQWVSNRLADDLGIKENLISPMIMPVSEGSCNMTMEGQYCPEHGLMECGGGMYEDSRSRTVPPRPNIQDTPRTKSVAGAGRGVVNPASANNMGDSIPRVEIRGFGPDFEDLPAGKKLINPMQLRRHNELSPLKSGDSTPLSKVANVDLTMDEDGGAVGMPYSMGEGVDDPINYNAAMTGSYYEGKETDIQEGDALLARIKSLALLR
jgi:hypothetical protein